MAERQRSERERPAAAAPARRTRPAAAGAAATACASLRSAPWRESGERRGGGASGKRRGMRCAAGRSRCEALRSEWCSGGGGFRTVRGGAGNSGAAVDSDSSSGSNSSRARCGFRAQSVVGGRREWRRDGRRRRKAAREKQRSQKKRTQSSVQVNHCEGGAMSLRQQQNILSL